MTFEYVLTNNGWYDGTNVTMNYDVNFNYMTAAFESGIADYCTMFEPVASDYEAAGKGYVVASVGEESGEVPYTCFIAKESWLDKNGETADGFLRAVMRAIEYVKTTDSAAVAELLVPYFDGTGRSRDRDFAGQLQGDRRLAGGHDDDGGRVRTPSGHHRQRGRAGKARAADRPCGPGALRRGVCGAARGVGGG